MTSSWLHPTAESMVDNELEACMGSHCRNGLNRRRIHNFQNVSCTMAHRKGQPATGKKKWGITMTLPIVSHPYKMMKGQ